MPAFHAFQSRSRDMWREMLEVQALSGKTRSGHFFQAMFDQARRRRHASKEDAVASLKVWAARAADDARAAAADANAAAKNYAKPALAQEQGSSTAQCCTCHRKSKQE